jgi:ubiquinone/menaquinone biosynthesis C-methylase UbiE
MSIDYSPHTLEWTDEKVARFWNFRNNYAPYDNTWFTQQAGPAVLKMANSCQSINGKVLDYGTGKGYLVDYLLSDYTKAEIYACDFTEDPAKETNRKNQGRKMFMGCNHITALPSVYEENYFDMVFLIETIEHLTDNYLHATLKEIYRILRPGGVVVITTPNNEDLEKTYVHCADCGASFHHMQHIRSWNTNSLGKLMKDFSFNEKLCKGVNIQWYGKRGMMHWISDTLKGWMRKAQQPNLVYIGSK